MLKNYPEYKESKIDWLGQVPSSWRIIRLKSLVQKIDEPTETYDFLIAVENIEAYTGNLIPSSEVQEFLGAKWVFRPGDVLFNKLRPYLTKVYYTETAGAVVGELLVLRSKKGFLSKMLFYRLIARDFIEIVNSSTEGTKMPRANWESFIRNLHIAVPSEAEQETIVSFLDEKCALIDQFIVNREEQIKLLELRLRNLIRKAVIEGINPGLEMIDSGVYWLGRIPAHWRTWKVSRAFKRIGSGTTPPSSNRDYYDDEGTPWINTGDLPDGLIVDVANRVSELAREEFSGLKLYPVGSIIIAMYGATIGKVGMLTFEAAVNQACCVLSSSRVLDMDYALQLFLSMKEDIRNLSQGGGQPNISQDTIRSLRIPVPPLEEQREILAYIREQSEAFSKLKSILEQTIEELRAWKQSIIYEAVTGKIDLRGYTSASNNQHQRSSSPEPVLA